MFTLLTKRRIVSPSLSSPCTHEPPRNKGRQADLHNLAKDSLKRPTWQRIPFSLRRRGPVMYSGSLASGAGFEATAGGARRNGTPSVLLYGHGAVMGRVGPCHALPARPKNAASIDYCGHDFASRSSSRH